MVGRADPGILVPSVTILLPALNEERAIGTVIDQCREVLFPRGFQKEIVVMDGNSSDRTVELATAKGATVLVQNGTGKGAAVREAFAAFDTDYLIMLDSDLTYPVHRIPRFLALLQSHDVVMGSRLRGKIEAGAMPLINHAGNRMLTWFARILYKKPISDVCTGMWGFRRAVLDKMVLYSSHFEIEAEIFASCAQNGLRFAEIPIEYKQRVGEPKLGSLRAGVTIFNTLWKLRPQSAKRNDDPDN